MSLITYLTRIHFADRVLEDALAEECGRLGLRRVLLVSDAEGEAPGLADRLIAALPPECDALRFPGARLPLAEQDVLRLAQAAAAEGCDGLIGLGGPAALRLALRAGIARLPASGHRPGIRHAGPLPVPRALGRGVQDAAAGQMRADPAWPGRRRGAAAPAANAVAAAPAAPRRGGLPVLAVPTTSACVGLAAQSWWSRPGAAPVPAVVFCDPTLTLWSAGAGVAAYGMETLSGCIECYLSDAWNPPADGIALDGLRRVGLHLEAAVRDADAPGPPAITARRELLAAGLAAGLASQKGLGAAAALARAVLAETGGAVPAGAVHAALLPPVLRFNRPAIAARLPALAEALRLPDGSWPQDWIAALAGRLGLPVRLTAAGVTGAGVTGAGLAGTGLTAAAIERITERALEDPALRTNPRLVDAAACRQILAEAL